MTINVNTKIYELFDDAYKLLTKSNLVGETDRHENEGIFTSMQAIGLMRVNSFDIDITLIGLFKLCLITSKLTHIKDIEDIEVFSHEISELGQTIVDSCPELKAIKNSISGMQLLKEATNSMMTNDRNGFIKEITEVMESYDLLGEEAVRKIFCS
jgi:hypothetical protein